MQGADRQQRDRRRAVLRPIVAGTGSRARVAYREAELLGSFRRDGDVGRSRIDDHHKRPPPVDRALDRHAIVDERERDDRRRARGAGGAERGSEGRYGEGAASGEQTSRHASDPSTASLQTPSKSWDLNFLPARVEIGGLRSTS